MAVSLTGQNVACPSCKAEFFATSPEPVEPAVPQNPAPSFTPPAKLPFFKSGRRKILEQRLQDLMLANNGTMTDDVEVELNKDGIALGLPATEGSELLKEHFLRDLEPIKRRMESSFVMTDDDIAAIEQLKTQYNVRAALGGTADLFRSIYLTESTGNLPAPIETDLMLDAGERAFYSVESVWHQTRVHSRGYSGTSVGLPTGIKGVRFRFGGYTPIKTEDITALSRGTLFLTSNRLLFNGDSKNTTVSLKKVIDGHIFSDCLRIDKSTGKPDFFSMNPAQARYILAMIGALK